MNAKQLIDLIIHISQTVGLDSDLCLAIAGHETGFDSDKTRYEPHWTYWVDSHHYAEHLGITLETEIIHQSTSWGPMQIMGSVCRELGYLGQLPLLINPELSVLFSCRKLGLIQKKYSSLSDQISAYNSGVPLKIQGVYTNSAYVTDILNRISMLKSVQ